MSMIPVNDLHPDYIGRVVMIRLVARKSTGTEELGKPDFTQVEDFVGVLESYSQSKKQGVIHLVGLRHGISINPNRTFVDMSVREETE